jgi:hypothetical protein
LGRTDDIDYRNASSLKRSFRSPNEQPIRIGFTKNESASGGLRRH